jgi:hypothetical protein
MARNKGSAWTARIMLLSAIAASSVALANAAAPGRGELTCPASAVIGQPLTLTKSRTAGSELAVIRPDGKFLFLVVGSPDAGMHSLMTPEVLAASTQVTMDTRTLEGYDWESNRKVFTKPGVYTFLISDNLESDDSAFRCQVRVVAGR